MISNLIRKINQPEKKRLFDNIFSLYVLQGANYILPLLTIPYLIRTIGIDYFGLLAFSTATIGYLLLITDYGFNLSATQQISIYRNDNAKINEIFSAIISIKIFLIIFTFSILCTLVLCVGKFNEHSEIYFLTFGLVVGQSLFPIWLFQGMEKIKIITLLNFFTRIFITACIFIFIKKREDYFIVPILNTIGMITASFLSIYISYKLFNIKIKIVSSEMIKHQLKEGWYIFTSTLYISSYTLSTIFILGLFTNNTVVGYFSAVDKIIQSLKGLYHPISQSLYPFLSKKYTEDKSYGLFLLRKILFSCGAAMFITSILTFFFAKNIINIIYGKEQETMVLLLKIMAFLPFIVTLNDIIGILWLLGNGYKKEVNQTVKLASCLHISYAIVFMYFFHAIGAGISMIITEIIVLCGLTYFYKSKIDKN